MRRRGRRPRRWRRRRGRSPQPCPAAASLIPSWARVITPAHLLVCCRLIDPDLAPHHASSHCRLLSRWGREPGRPQGPGCRALGRRLHDATVPPELLRRGRWFLLRSGSAPIVRPPQVRSRQRGSLNLQAPGVALQLAWTGAIDQNGARVGVATQTVMPTGHLLERQTSVERLRAALERARSGEGCVVVVEGEAGIGKTALLGVARDLAAGDTVLAARGGKLERDSAHGIARQLYEPLFRATPARHRRALLRGAAELSAPVLGLAAAADRSAADPGFAAKHRLYSLQANLADRQPLLVVVDDAHGADSASLLFLNY